VTYPNQAADSLHALRDAAEVRPLSLAGTVPGVAPLLAAGRNGPGAGRIRWNPTAAALQYQAPDSATWGDPQTATADGTFLLVDGEDASKCVRVAVYTTHLGDAPTEARVLLADRYLNGIPFRDATAAEATAGDVDTYTLTLTNAGTVTVSALVAWLDADTAGLEISDDGATWVTPTTEGTALALSDLAPAASATLHARRTIAASADADPDILDLIHLAFDAL